MAVRTKRAGRLASGFVVCAVVFGCTPAGPSPVRMQGDVTFGGQPLTNGTIILTPVEGTPGPSTGGGVTDGRYDIPADKGPVSGGTYRVEVTALRKTGKAIPNMFDADKKPVELSEQYLPAAYNTQSALKVTLPPSTSRIHLDIPLASDGSAVTLSPR